MAGLNLNTADLQDFRPGLCPFESLPPSVAIVDDDVSTRRSLARLIGDKGWCPHTFATAQDFLEHTSQSSAPNCLILELSLSDMSGLALQEFIAPRMADTPIMFLTSEGNVPATVRAMKAGAVEFFTKPTCDEVLASAVERAIVLNRASLAKRRETQTIEALYSNLSPREREVMDLVVCGHLNKVVAFQLGISEITVKAHRGQVMRKMQARSFVDLVNMAARIRASLRTSN